MKSILFILVAIVATLPLKAQWDPFDPILVNVADVQMAEKFLEKCEVVRFRDLFPEPQPVPDFSCYNDSSCTTWGPWKKDTAIVSHPLHPDCPIYIGYLHRNCTTDQSFVQHHITSMTYRENDPDCTSLNIWLLNGGSAPDPDRLNQLYHDLYALLAKEMFIEFNNLSMYGWNDTLYCDAYTHFKVSYVKGTCMGWCNGYYRHNDTGVYSVTGYPKYCDADACCKVTNAFCIDRKTGKLKHSEDVEYGPQPTKCEVEPITENECYEMHHDSEYSTLEQVRVLKCKPSCDINFLDLGGDVIVE